MITITVATASLAAPGISIDHRTRRFAGIDSLYSFIPLRSAPWVLVAVYPTTEAFAGLRARQRKVLMAGSGLYIAAAVLVWLMSGWLLRPLARLRAVMNRQASDLGLPLALGSYGSAELASLAVAYNAQAARRREFEDRLKASERRMRDITDNLPVLIGYVDMDGRYASTFRSWLGFDAAWVVGHRMSEVLGSDVYESLHEKVQRCLVPTCLS